MGVTAKIASPLNYVFDQSAVFEQSYVFDQSEVLALIIVLIATVNIAAALFGFGKARTTVNPLKPEATSKIVTTGIYRFSHNPMYLGFLLFLLAWAVFLSNASAYFFLPAFVFYMNCFQIIPEERALAEKFGEQFKKYRLTVRRWI